MLMRNGWRVATGLGLGVLRFAGADAGTFLQGQLSNDVTRLAAGQVQLSGYHTPQGRVIAVLRLAALATDDFLAVLPGELVAPVAARLQRYVLRARVRITDSCAHWRILGYAQAPPAPPEGALLLPHGASRQLLLLPAAAAPPDAADGGREEWSACDIAEGLPQVYAATSEAFVAQMLNLDVAGGIALDKGCYTGQEIIARSHYRGQVKRRMQRFASEGACSLVPGQGGVLGDGRSFKVVEAVALAAGRSEFLAVTTPAPQSGDLAAQPEESEAAAGAETLTLVPARQLALPYSLPWSVPRARA
jgi:tRNA-modifying protein YgfZ